MSTPSANVRAASIFSSPIFSAGQSLDTQAVLHFLKSVSLGFWIEEKDDEELQHHHGPEKHEGIGAGRFRKLRKRISNDGVHDPVRRAPTLCPLARTRLGNTSLMYTQITAPCEMAKK